MNPAEFCLRYRTVTLVLTVVMFGAGLRSYQSLSRLEDPEFTIKDALVMTPYPGASAAEAVPVGAAMEAKGAAATKATSPPEFSCPTGASAEAQPASNTAVNRDVLGHICVSQDINFTVHFCSTWISAGQDQITSTVAGAGFAS